MPSGVYVRKPSQKRDEAIARNFAKGRAPEVRAAVNETLRRVTWTDEKRKEVSERTKEIMHRPDVREKHLRALEGRPVNFRGGNGQPLLEVVRVAAQILEPKGFIRECPIKTKYQKTQHKVPSCYKVDFGHPGRKLAIELDGTTHSPMKQKELDKKKMEVLESLGWTVVRIKHWKEVQPSLLSAEIAEQLATFL
jgi:hypothetical protein